MPICVVEKGRAPGSHAALRRSRQPSRDAAPLPRDAGFGDAVRGARRARGRVLPEGEARAADPDAPADAQRPQLLRIGQQALPVARRARRGARRDDRPGDERREAARVGRARGRRQDRETRGGGETARSCRTRSRAATSRVASPFSRRAPSVISPAPRSSTTTSPARRRCTPSGVKEVWEVGEAARADHPHDRLAAAAGEALARVRRAASSTRWARTSSRSGMVVGLDYTDPALSVHDMLQQLKTHPLVEQDPSGRQANRLGREDDSRGWLPVDPAERLHFPGGLHRRRCRRPRERSGAQGHPLRDGVRPPGGGGCPRRGRAGVDRLDAGASRATTKPCARASSGSDLRRERNLRPAFAQGFVVGSALAGHGDGHVRQRAAAATWPFMRTPTPSSRSPSPRAYPQPDGTLTFDKLSSVFASGTRRATTRRTTSGSGATSRGVSPRPGSTCVRRRCTRSPARRQGDLVTVEVTASNCVQCGAITAKGGRLTIPEGGDGPEYTVM